MPRQLSDRRIDNRLPERGQIRRQEFRQVCRIFVSHRQDRERRRLTFAPFVDRAGESFERRLALDFVRCCERSRQERLEQLVEFRRCDSDHGRRTCCDKSGGIKDEEILLCDRRSGLSSVESVHVS